VGFALCVWGQLGDGGSTTKLSPPPPPHPTPTPTFQHPTQHNTTHHTHHRQVLGAGVSSDVVELHYCLGGAGALLGAHDSHIPVAPGDSIISVQGAAMFVANVTGDATSDAIAQPPGPLVLLQILLPGKLLRDVAAGQRTVFTNPSELGIRPEWEAPSVLKAGRVSQELMCSLLSPDAAHSAHTDARAAVAGPPPPGAAATTTGATSVQDALEDQSGRPYGDEVVVEPYQGSSRVQKRSLSGVRAWQMPNATNQLALMFGPHTDPELSMTFGVEMFEPGHRTTRHIHTAAYEMFIVLGGEGVGINNSEKIPLKAGDVALFPPHVIHAIDNPSDRRLYCLQVRRGWRGLGVWA